MCIKMKQLHLLCDEYIYFTRSLVHLFIFSAYYTQKLPWNVDALTVQFCEMHSCYSYAIFLFLSLTLTIFECLMKLHISSDKIKTIQTCHNAHICFHTIHSFFFYWYLTVQFRTWTILGIALQNSTHLKIEPIFFNNKSKYKKSRYDLNNYRCLFCSCEFFPKQIRLWILRTRKLRHTINKYICKVQN